MFQYFQEELDRVKEKGLLFNRKHYRSYGSIRLTEQDIVNHTYQQLCLLGRLNELRFSIQKADDIRILDYVRGTTTIWNMEIRVQTPVKIPKGLIPETVVKLSILLFLKYGDDQYRYRGLLEEGSIPSSVKFLSTESILFKHNVRLVPDSVQELKLGSWSYTPGDTVMLPKVKILSILYSVDDSFLNGALPQSITELRINYPLVKPIPVGALPESLKHLILQDLSHPLEIGSLPSKLETFHVINHFSPENTINKPGILPESLTKLRLDWITSDINLDFIPKSCDYNTVQEFPKGLLPSGLKTLDLSRCSMSSLNGDDIHTPNSIQLLKLHHYYTKIKLLSEWIPKLFSQSKSRFQLECIGTVESQKNVVFLSTHPSDPYIYYNMVSTPEEGYISKSNIQSFLKFNFIK
eukprot:gene10829-13272_t